MIRPEMVPIPAGTTGPQAHLRTLIVMPYVVGALGSKPVSSKGMGRAAGGPTGAGREPKGRRHAVDLETGVAACGTFDSLRVFDDYPWTADGDVCPACAAVAPFER